jgi:thiamine-phosphate pyrophosphorylase
MQVGRLHVLTDFHFQQRLSHAEIAKRAIAGGADTIQFRQKAGPLRNKLAELHTTVAVCRQQGVTVLVDDHVDLCMATGASGVHLGQDDLPIPLARRILGADAVIGATASTVEEARAAEAARATYIGFGPVFPTSSKANPRPVRGLPGLAAASGAVSIPVIAIAGVTAAKVRDAIEAGAHGIAVMTAVTTAPDVERATALLRAALDEALGI